MKRSRLLGIVALLVVFAIASGGGFALYARGQLDPPQGGHGPTVTIDVRAGETLDQVTADLAAHGLIRSAYWFGLYARWRGLGSRLRPGPYRLDPGMGASAIVGRLDGPPDTPVRQVVLAEGLTGAQMAERVGSAGIGITAADYLAAVHQRAQLSIPAVGGRSPDQGLEGLLFPDTYVIPTAGGAHDLVQEQLDTFARKAVPVLDGATRLGAYQTLIVASLVEREAAAPADRPLVAGVIMNRLARGIYLQVDASVLYGLGIEGRAPTAAELSVDTVYNTYLHTGLPPTPIANPGVASIQAAVSPTATDYLFYVSDNSGHIHYSVDSATHSQQCMTYLGRAC